MGEGGRTFAVFAMLKDKDIGGVIAAVKSHVAHWYFSGLGGARGASVGQIAQALEAASVSAATACEDVVAAYTQACDIAAENDRIVVFGSFFTVAAVMRLRESRQVRSGNGGKRAAVDGAND
jgi:dihydrofolate synthase/folylpolyglutamate synthase